MMNLRSSGPEKTQGFTLIELMFSSLILTLVLLSAFYVLVQAHHMSVESRTRLLALNTARSVIEEIKNTPLQNVSAIATAQFVPAALPGGAAVITTNPTPLTAASTLATVTVTVSWRASKNALRTLQLSTMRSAYS